MKTLIRLLLKDLSLQSPVLAYANMSETLDYKILGHLPYSNFRISDFAELQISVLRCISQFQIK